MQSNKFKSLRIKAEAQLSAQLEERPAEELLYELRVHQVQLEMQNEALRHSHLELEESRSRYIELYDFSPCGYLTLTQEGFIAEMNLTACVMFREERNKLLQRRFCGLVAAENGDAWHLFFTGAIKHGDQNMLELTLKRNDDSEFYVQLNCLKLISPNQQTTLHICLTDITERIQAETALHKSDTFKHAVLNAVPSMIAVLDSVGAIIAVNESWRRFAVENGLEPGKPAANTHVGINYLDVCRTDVDECAQKAFQSIVGVLEGRLPQANFEYPCHSPSEQRWFIASVTPLDAEHSGAVIVHTDISENKRMQLAQRVAAAAFESQEGMVITDQQGVITQVNRAFTRLTGYSAEEAIGQTPRMLSSGRHDAAFYQQMWETIAAQGSWQGEILNRRKNGEIYPEWLSINAVSAEDGGISHYVACFSDISSNKEAVAKIHQLAYYDPLTSLPNRRLFQERLIRALVLSQRSKHHGAVLFIDLDNFKKLNDTLGHDTGDVLLVQVAERLLACMREGDTVARLGGDEFVITLEELSKDYNEAAFQVQEVGEKILASLNQPYPLRCHDYHSTPSIGVALFQSDKGLMDDLLKRADMAMYAAKAAGRNTLRFFDPEMQKAVMARAVLETDLIRGLEERQFQLYFQLQATHQRRIIGAEVLLRWEHPERGLVSPAAFIPLAEETRLILPLGLWVLEAACAQLKRWEASVEARHLQLAVNVSPIQFHEACFVEQVRTVLKKYAIQPNRLKLELTESVVLNDICGAIDKMQELKEIGVQFSLDDFGTGFSSLAYLTQLPLCQLKIDQSFVRNIGVKPSDAVIVQTIIGMAKNLGMDVIAEGVETEQQRVFLQQSGCPAIQGYLFGRPVPIEQFEQLLIASAA